MAAITEAEIIQSVQTTLESLSPQIRYDVDKGAFYYLAARAIAPLLSQASGSVDLLAQISTFNFPAVVTSAQASATARAFGLSLGVGGFSHGVAYFFTSRRPQGTEVMAINQGDTISTATNRGISFEALETRVLTATNADAYYNPANRRYELPVLVQALTAGTGGNIAARSLTRLTNGTTGSWDGVTNLQAFTGGKAAASVSDLYARVQDRLPGLDQFSRGGLVSFAKSTDPDRITDVQLTYSSEYPALFYRLPDDQAIDVWVEATENPTPVTETFVATGGQTQFYVTRGPVLGLNTCFVNGASVGATLVPDTSQDMGQSTRERSYVSLAIPASSDDRVDITYTYDTVLNNMQQQIDGYLQADTGALFSTDVLCRYKQNLPLLVSVVCTVLGTYSAQVVKSSVETAAGAYIATGDGSGSVRSAQGLRDYLSGNVAGLASIRIPTFCRKQYGDLVEVIDIPRNTLLSFELSTDLSVRVN